MKNDTYIIYRDTSNRHFAINFLNTISFDLYVQ